MEPDKIFVYGILRTKEEENEAILKGYRKFYRTHATIEKRPFENCFVVGEILPVDEETIAKYDMIEGVDSGYYHRMIVEATYPDGTEVPVWVYQQVADKEKDSE